MAFERADHRGLARMAGECRGRPGRFGWLIETRLEAGLLGHAAEVLVPGGAVVLKSRHREESAFPARRWAEKRLDILGRSRSSFPDAMEWLSRHAGELAPLFGRRFPLSRWEEAFAAANGGEAGKVFVVPDGAVGEFRRLGGTGL